MKLDHIVFGTRDLAQGTAFMSDALGATPVGGGKHPLMGTHNSLWRLEAHGYPVYLEVIAIDPDAEQPKISRWYGLDNASVQSRMGQGVSLLTYALQSENIEADRVALPVDPGVPTKVRRGNLSWQFTVTEDGNLIANGALPHLISWGDSEHPTKLMPNQGVSLIKLEGTHITSLNVDWPCDVVPSDNKALKVKLIRADGAARTFESVV